MYTFSKIVIVSLTLTVMNEPSMRFISSKMRYAARMPLTLIPRLSVLRETRNLHSSLVLRGKWQERHQQLQKDVATIKLVIAKSILKDNFQYSCNFNAIRVYKNKKGESNIEINFSRLKQAYIQRNEDLSWCLEKLQSIKDIPNLKQDFPESEELINQATNEQKEISERLEILMDKQNGSLCPHKLSYPIR